MHKRILMLLMLAAAVVVAGCGAGEDKATSTAGNSTDRAFVAAMIPHHESAVEMAKIARQRGESQFVKTLADNIIRSQTAEISTMKAEDASLAEADVAKGELGMDHSMMGMDMDTSALRTATPFDPAFFTMMIPHHEGAVAMAKVELSKGQDPKLQTLARNIISAQQKEISQMKAQ